VAVCPAVKCGAAFGNYPIAMRSIGQGNRFDGIFNGGLHWQKHVALMAQGMDDSRPFTTLKTEKFHPDLHFKLTKTQRD
jgi:hypothetical protein